MTGLPPIAIYLLLGREDRVACIILRHLKANRLVSSVDRTKGVCYNTSCSPMLPHSQGCGHIILITILLLSITIVFVDGLNPTGVGYQNQVYST